MLRKLLLKALGREVPLRDLAEAVMAEAERMRESERRFADDLWLLNHVRGQRRERDG